MSNLNPPSVNSLCSLDFLQQNPSLSDSLLADCDYDLDEVATVVEPILMAPKRCRFTSFYIQAVNVGRTIFLTTNLLGNQIPEVASLAPCWLIGRSLTCAIRTQHRSVSRRHAVIGHRPFDGFYLTDIGSSNGTWVNCCPLIPAERRILRDGDLLQLGRLQVEFFLSARKKLSYDLEDTTSY